MIFDLYPLSLESAWIASIVSCWKRANRFEQEGEIDQSHPLYPSWMNALGMMDGKKSDATITGLAFFAEQVEAYSHKNLLKGDQTLSAMLYNWKQKLWFDPEILANDHLLNEWFFTSTIANTPIPVTYSKLSNAKTMRDNGLGYKLSLVAIEDEA